MSVGLARGLAGAKQIGGGAGGLGEGEGDEGHEKVELARDGQAGVLEVEASGYSASPKRHSMAQRLR